MSSEWKDGYICIHALDVTNTKKKKTVAKHEKSQLLYYFFRMSVFINV